MGQLSYRLAYDAIEQFVVEQDLDGQGGGWREIVPTEDWGFDDEAWESAATVIVDLFNERLPDDLDIDVPPVAKRRSGSKPLINFRRYLAAKADDLNSAPVIDELEG
jgi:hypothetical protein